MQSSIEVLREAIENSNNIVFFGGAGVSTESGIPDYRGPKGLYTQKNGRCTPPPSLNMKLFKDAPENFFDYYRKHMLSWNAEPNAAHYKLAELEKQGKLKAVITQNIDGLHQAAGSKTVCELHGSVHRNYCENCGAFFDATYIKKSEGIPKCDKCGGPIKPDVVLYEEGLDQKTMMDSIRFISNADMLIVGGTSLAVYPAAGLIDYYEGDKLVLINKTPTPRDRQADLVVTGAIGEIFSQL